MKASPPCVYRAKCLVFFLVSCVACIGIADVAVWGALLIWRHLETGSGDDRYKLPNYDQIPWAGEHFREWNSLRSEYRSFIGWRRKDFRGQTITIEQGIRQSAGQAMSGSVCFFGGSAIWGTGVNDETTIPSLFHRTTARSALNLAEGAYTSRQSLDMLLNMLSEGYRPEAIVDYEGANEVSVHCLKWVKHLPVHYTEDGLRAALGKGRLEHVYEWANDFIWYVPERIKNAVAPKEDTTDIMDCHANPEKARRVARNLIDNWKFMKAIAEKRRIPFYAVLQPTIFTARTKTDHLPQKEFAMKQEYAAVYPLMRQEAEDHCNKRRECGIFLDLSDFDFGDRYVFIDYVHLSPNGNELIAEALSRVVR